MATVIITGASSGIGRETAIKLKNEGFLVVGTYNSSKDCAQLLNSQYNIPMIRCDVSVESDVIELFARVKRDFGRVSAVISNAGIALKQKPFIDVGVEEIDKLISVNLKGTMLVNKHAVNAMLLGGGKIINVSSVFGLEGGSCEALYSATKAGVIGLTRALSEELEGSDISVSAVAFGLVDTAMNAHLSSEDKLAFVKECGLESVPTAKDAGEELYKILLQSETNGKIFKIFC
ncbi:MAG: SDR family oxidoreductase [Clostridia bacterium]|nr:SDR family oxidoreductase [Clostridia bacterium]